MFERLWGIKVTVLSNCISIHRRKVAGQPCSQALPSCMSQVTKAGQGVGKKVDAS